jgi:hypothetical protein
MTIKIATLKIIGKGYRANLVAVTCMCFDQQCIEAASPRTSSAVNTFKDYQDEDREESSAVGNKSVSHLEQSNEKCRKLASRLYSVT